MNQQLRRELGVFGATLTGLGSIIGTGVFVSIGIAAGVAGPAVVLAIAVAAVVATCNGLSSAQLAANHPVSGGTYEYGYRLLSPRLGFAAGWLFLCAKSASAATAALGFAGYALLPLGQTQWRIPLAVAAVVTLMLVVLSGIRRSSVANLVIVSISLFSLAYFVVAGWPTAAQQGASHLTPFFTAGTDRPGGALAGLLEATALMFVAYTGYGRIATLGEEVREPRKNIPRAVALTLFISMVVYMCVGLTAVAAAGAPSLGNAATEQFAPLQIVARQFSAPAAGTVLAVGAVTAMLGVLLNLILGLSRVVLAMARRADFPTPFSRLDRSGATPYPAVFFVAAVIVALVLLGDVKTTWSFSAFTVLVYYALTNLAALRLPKEQRLYPRAIAWFGLLACLLLAFWVTWTVWLAGLGVLAAGWVWQYIMQRRKHNLAK